RPFPRRGARGAPTPRADTSFRSGRATRFGAKPGPARRGSRGYPGDPLRARGPRPGAGAGICPDGRHRPPTNRHPRKLFHVLHCVGVGPVADPAHAGRVDRGARPWRGQPGSPDVPLAVHRGPARGGAPKLA
ncbi:hypothetical protein EWH23_14475, partial [Meiothermus sp. PNK-Is4]